MGSSGCAKRRSPHVAQYSRSSDLIEERARRHEKRAKRPPQRYRQREARRQGRLYVLRGRVRCALCDRRMEGTHQKGSKWYRCRFSTSRGRVAAEVAGHPRALQIKEDVILDHLLDFMGRRIFGPERLRLLRGDLARTISEDWREHDAHLHRLEAERDEIDRALYRQALRLEEHDDPDHPVVALAKRRILELNARREVIGEAIAELDGRRPDGSRPAEIEAMLAAVPDLRPALRSAPEGELADILERFDVEAVYDKPAAPSCWPPRSRLSSFRSPKRTDRPAGGRGILAIFP